MTMTKTLTIKLPLCVLYSDDPATRGYCPGGQHIECKTCTRLGFGDPSARGTEPTGAQAKKDQP
jgi:hypothetical protein